MYSPQTVAALGELTNGVNELKDMFFNFVQQAQGGSLSGNAVANVASVLVSSMTVPPDRHQRGRHPAWMSTISDTPLPLKIASLEKPRDDEKG
jgi:hypothetical protein